MGVMDPTPVPAPVELFAPAKLTIGLRIVGVRDDGFHLIDAEMVSLDVGDTLIVHERAASDPDPTMVEAFDARTGDPIEIGDDDLVRRALRLVGRRASVRIEKRIPPGAGLGGGSSDAAAILHRFGATDPIAAAAIGADVAFCLQGGRARVTGIGEICEQMPHEPRTFTLLTPPFGCSTPAVYRAWDELGGPVGDHGNDLEPAALAVEPRLAQVRDELAAVSGSRPRLAGSGSTWFVEGAFPGDGRVVVHTIPSR